MTVRLVTQYAMFCLCLWWPCSAVVVIRAIRGTSMSNEKRKLRSSSFQNSEPKKKKENKQSDKTQAYKGIEKPTQHGLKELRQASSKYHEEFKFEVKCNNCDKSLKEIINPTNHIHFLDQFQKGLGKSSVLQQIAEQVYLRDMQQGSIRYLVETPGLRVTSMQWHPHNPNLLVTGDRNGFVTLISSREEPTAPVVHNESVLKFYHSMGSRTMYGQSLEESLEAVRFNTKRSGMEVCTASMDGTISTYNFNPEKRTKLVKSATPTRIWFCSVDVHSDGKSVYGGDNMGKLATHHLDSGETRHQLMLHKKKITYLEFHTRNPNVMVTSSLDKTVKLWDIRMLDKNNHIECLEHDSAVSCATFSQTDGCRLLTTDQQDQIRVYKAPTWVLEHKISHPHRHYQCVTHIKATWHPFADLFVVARYPNPTSPVFNREMRSVDVYSALTGKRRSELIDPSAVLTRLAQFNCSGSLLATAVGRISKVWQLNKSQF
uniref:DNA damage-binding protein 2 n=1 Tax=Graphocephala atropunctata TaxID=36148 RepID=A0A1B6LCE5_9HEMI